MVRLLRQRTQVVVQVLHLQLLRLLVLVLLVPLLLLRLLLRLLSEALPAQDCLQTRLLDSSQDFGVERRGRRCVSWRA